MLLGCATVAWSSGCGEGAETAGSGGAEAGATGGTGSGAGSSEGAGGTGSTGLAGAESGAGGGPVTPGVGTVTPGPVTCQTAGDGITTLAFVNGCDEAVSARGSNDVAAELEPGAHVCVTLGSDVEPLSSLRYWGFIGEDPGGEHHSLAEFTFNTDFHDFDWYNLSHVDAHNLPLAIVPVGRDDCRTLSCPDSLLADCPEEGLYEDSEGNVVSCVSPDRDNAESPVAEYFEAACVDAYSWSGDDAESMAACAGEDFTIEFCP